MLKSILVTSIFVGSLNLMANDSATESLMKILNEQTPTKMVQDILVERENQVFPIKIDESTVINSIEQDKKDPEALIYMVKFDKEYLLQSINKTLNINWKDFPKGYREDFGNAAKKIMVDGLCKGELTGKSLKIGVKYKHVFYFSDGEVFKKFTILGKDCKIK